MSIDTGELPLVSEPLELPKVTWCVVCLADQPSLGWVVCRECEAQLSRDLSELESLTVELSLATALLPKSVVEPAAMGQFEVSVDAAEAGETGAAAKKAGLTPRRSKPGPKSPARDEVIALLDPRGGAKGGSIPGVLNGWRIELAKSIDVAGATFSGDWGSLLRCGWLDEFARDVRKVLRRAQAAVGRMDFAHRPVAVCTSTRVELNAEKTGLEQLPCNGDIWYRRTNASVYCAACKRMWSADRLIELAVQQMSEVRSEDVGTRMSTSTLADYFETSASIVRKWVHRSGAVRDENGLVRLEDIVRYREKITDD